MTSEKVPVPQTINDGGHLYKTADTTVAQTLYTGEATNGSIVQVILGTNIDDAQEHLLKLYLDDNLIGTIALPISAGDTGVIASVDLLNRTNTPGLQLDGNGNPYIKLKAGAELLGSVNPAVGDDDDVAITVLAMDL